MNLFFLKLGLLMPLFVFAQTTTPNTTSAIPVQPIQQIQGVPAQQPIQPQPQPQIPAQTQVQPMQQIQPQAAPQPATPQPATPQQMAQPTQMTNTGTVSPQTSTYPAAQPTQPMAQPTLPQQKPQPAAPQPAAPQPAAPQPAAQPLQVASLATTGDSKLPSDFEFIAISPYYKNKPRLGKLTATVVSATNEVLGTVVGDFGDCKTCIRGASIKGKLGIRFYGQSLKALTVSRKQSSSIQIEACPTNILVVQDYYSCDFTSGGNKMKMNMRLEP